MINRGLLRTAVFAASVLSVMSAMSSSSDVVSPKLAGLIVEFERRTAELDGTPEITLARDQVSNSRLRALNELLAYGPASLGKLADKLAALKPVIHEDSVSVDVLIDDARTLIGEAGR